jgi:hypothetical protein
MKVLIATRQGQGARPNDFFWANEGELVTFGSECCNESVDGPCGCRRSVIGLDTRKATTTFMVAEMPISLADYRDRIRGSIGRAFSRLPAADLEQWVEGDLAELLRVARAFDEGAVLESRGGRIAEREVLN